MSVYNTFAQGTAGSFVFLTEKLNKLRIAQLSRVDYWFESNIGH